MQQQDLGTGRGYSVGFARNIVSEKMRPYASALPPIYAKFGGQYLAMAGPATGAEHLHGNWGPRSIMLGEFATLEAVEAFWWSPEYRAAAQLRTGAVTVDVCRLRGQAALPGERALLVLAGTPSLAPAIAAAVRAHGTLIAPWPQDSNAQTQLEGDLDGLVVSIGSFAERATLTRAWSAILALPSVAPNTLQAYAVPRKLT
jgi:uncharacterized protein (DUF1330 family)